MARIVLGIGSSHTPQVSTTTEWWEDHANRDRRNPYLLGRDGEPHTYEELAAVPEWAVDPTLLTPPVWESLHARAQKAITTLREEFAAVAPDAVVVIGDDQNEMFLDDGMPTFAVYWGQTVMDMPPTEAKRASMAKGLEAALWATHNESIEHYTVPGDLGRHIIEQLMLEEFDVVALARQPADRSIGHAFTFVRRRLMGEQMIPMLPVALNSYNPPNQPSPRRCFMFGRALRQAIESYPEDLAIAVVASGGLSHFVVDEDLDRGLIEALRNCDTETLTTIPRKFMRSGTSELLNWIAAGGVLEELTMDLLDYIPAYRSPAGTGVGMAFALWR